MRSRRSSRRKFRRPGPTVGATVTVAEAPVDSDFSEAVIWTVIQKQPEIHWSVNVAGAEAPVTAWY